ncbi:hypothetical protein Hdeb2414_s0019g00546511 [Helianthus debilis subsp. tardiflorus]
MLMCTMDMAVICGGSGQIYYSKYNFLWFHVILCFVRWFLRIGMQSLKRSVESRGV